MDLFNVPSAHIGLKWRRLALTLLLPQFMVILAHIYVLHAFVAGCWHEFAFSASCKWTSNTPLLESGDGAHFSIMHLQEEKRALVCVRQLGPSACPRVLHIKPVQPPQDLPRSQESLWHPASAYIVCVIWPHRYLSPTQASMPPRPCPDYLQLAADHFLAGATV